MTLLDALDDSAIFGRHFGPEWDAWRVYLKALFALPMSSGDLELYHQCTGRPDAPTVPAREAWTICGRRAGKSRMASVISVFLAAFRDYRDVLSVGEVGTLPVIASDRRQARTCMSYISALLDETPMLASMVTHRTTESVELTTGVRIGTLLGLTQRQFGERVGVQRNTVARWERDELTVGTTAAILIQLLAKQTRETRRKGK